MRAIRRFGVAAKLWLAMLALNLGVSALVGIGLDRAVRDFYNMQNTREMLEFGGRLADFWVRASEPGAAEAVRAIAQLAGTPIMVLDGGGRVVTGSGSLAQEVGRRISTVQVEEALRGEASVVLATYPTLPGSLFVAAVPIRRGDAVDGVVLLFRAADEVRAAVKEMRTLLGVGGLALVVLASAFAWLLSRRIVRPLLRVEEAADRMARGDYSARVDVKGDDELRALADSVNRLAESLDRLEKGRRAFFANVSHELRTPLSYVRGYADAIAEGLVPEGEVRETGRILSEESKRLSGLVDDLFDLAQADEGKLSLRVQRVDAVQAVRDLLGRLAPEANRRGIELTAIGEGEAWVRADPARLDQVLINLIDNALAFTPAGGQAAVRVARRGENVVVSVEDSGPGLDPAEIDRLWDRFYRGEAKGRSGGGGLGLSIVRSLIEAQGGTVFADNESEFGGARFGFTLPAA